MAKWAEQELRECGLLPSRSPAKARKAAPPRCAECPRCRQAASRQVDVPPDEDPGPAIPTPPRPPRVVARPVVRAFPPDRRTGRSESPLSFRVAHSAAAHLEMPSDAME